MGCDSEKFEGITRGGRMKFCNLIFRGLTKKDVFEIKNNKPNFIITCNAKFIVKSQKNERFKKIINQNIATIDGQIPFWLFKLKYKNIHAEKLSGSDLIYDFCEFASIENKRVFLLGGYEDSNLLAQKKLQEKYKIEIAGYSPPYEEYPFSKETNKKIVDRLLSFKPHILFVSFGAMKQEFWIDDHMDILKEIGVEYVMGVGGAFDFVSGRIKRAPKVVQRAGLEWLWRLIMEPKFFRVKRVFISSLIFYYFIKEEVLR
jgi:N-acetylglucosaminyldiphosphoundecaprenol N-acetyl-beta-D-mannosaminyltransferase